MIFNQIKRSVYWILLVANHDFCPRLAKVTNWIKEPVGWVVTVIVFSLLVGLMIGPQGYVMAAAFSAFLASAIAWPWVSMKGIRCSLVSPQSRVREGEEVTLIFRVKNFWPLPVYGLMVKGDFLSAGAEPVAFSLQHVRAWSEAEFSIRAIPQRRGRFPSPDVVVCNGFPFGLIEVSKPLSQIDSSLVWPACESLEGLPKAQANGFSLQGGLVDQPGNEGETIGVRCYRDGDRIRNIHWAQSVRSQRLMVRERQRIVTSTATVIVDLSPANHAQSGRRSSFECAIRIAGTLCNHFHESGSPVRLSCVGLAGKQLLHVDNSRGIATILDFLAELPTMDLAQAKSCEGANSETKGNNQIAVHSPAFARRDYFIGTDGTNQLHNKRWAACRQITIKLEEFASPSAPLESPHLDDRIESGNVIVIANPDLAASQLVNGWNGSYGHVA